MSISRHAALAASVILNLTLGAVLLIHKPEQAASSTPAAGLASSNRRAATAPPTQVAVDLPQPASITAKDYYQALLRKDLSDAERALLLIGHLHKEQDSRASRAAYWMQKTSLAESQADIAQLRAEVLAVVGERAWDDANFAQVFRPLKSDLPNLDPKKQVAAHTLLQRYYAAIENRQADAAAFRELVERNYVELQQDLRAALGDADYQEFTVRMSPLAQAVRRMGLSLTEAQHRELIAKLGANEQLRRLALRQDSRKTSLNLYDASFSKLLGPEQHIALLTRIDPVYASLSALAASKSIPPDQLRAPYTAFVAQQQATAQPAKSSTRLPPATAFAKVLGPTADFVVHKMLTDAVSG